MEVYMERSLADCPLPDVPLEPPYGLRVLSAEQAGVWTRVQYGVFGEKQHRTYEQVYGSGDYAALRVFLASCGPEPVGIGAGAVRRTPRNVRHGYVDWVGVLAPHRGRRVGSALTVAAINFLAAQGLEHISLWTQDYRAAAMALYQRHGFRTVPLPPGAGLSEFRLQRADAGYPPLDSSRAGRPND
jgi:ribosomal protein S18 acetylase RimI-like enzyme